MTNGDPLENPYVIAWLNALESDEYEQGRHLLVTVNEDGKRQLCCLGVACDVIAPSLGYVIVIETVDGSLRKEVFTKGGPDGRRITESMVLPSDVRDRLGLTGNEGDYYDGSGKRRTLTQLNDEALLSFKEIAAVIRSRPRGLFAVD